MTGGGGSNKVTASLAAARRRFRRLPEHLAQCKQEASTYAKCIEGNVSGVQKDMCAQEFSRLLACVKAAAAKK
ncbi:hypothetical protein PTSG_05852 [Salpingoeca rosetta]|uniref:IMS import disulfide relay-system CHCH-CHCH-like Cx9C domain-containing protein n=1 Tax=Salpingoeca rosetta (strain ATCC 50818 / BSB-021) TaxID=946362 RepID=F2UCZ3_SALR5|nr:uncharacterized protein PTSG_05852 [Salpingoeca rosetta]EGD74488.1 hypothetical protein PTSG_05852 [Salpingoeca rosetta]|eukprot:XP_004992745.1 hypothetical protein PTSG_05852 [Salpingoeca rosetta]